MADGGGTELTRNRPWRGYGTPTRGKRGKKVRKLTTETMGWSARTETVDRRRNRRNTAADVAAVFELVWPLRSSPGCVSWGGRRGGRGATPGGRDWKMAESIGGNGAAAAELGFRHRGRTEGE